MLNGRWNNKEIESLLAALRRKQALVVILQIPAMTVCCILQRTAEKREKLNRFAGTELLLGKEAVWSSDGGGTERRAL